MSERDAPGAWIEIRGARENNLRDITVRIPRRALTVVTGVSGSGKSSLAVDTLYAEGRRRYLDAVGVHARRFLEQLPRPAVEGIDGLSPAVAMDQRRRAPGARSTVGTATEVYDYLRLLFARAGRAHCDRCGSEVPRWTTASVAATPAPGDRVVVAFPPPGDAGGGRARGYLRLVRDGVVRDRDGDAPVDPGWDVVQDRVRGDNRARLREAVEAAAAAGDGRVALHVGAGRRMFRLGRVCAACDLACPEPEPLHFSFNSPAGACPACHGFGYELVIDPARIVPDPALSIDEGALQPWAGKWRGHFRRKLAASEFGRGIPVHRPWRELDAEQQRFLIHGDRTFRGAVPFLERLRREKGYRAGVRFLVKRFQTQRRCAACDGTRLGPAGRRVRLGGHPIPAWCALPVAEVPARLRALDLGPEEAAAAASILTEIHHRLEVLVRVGLGYLTLDRATRTLSGGEAQRIEIAQALGARLTGALYVLDEPTVGLHPRDTGRLLAVIRDLVERGNTAVLVEHDRDVIAASDWTVELGPGAGHEGGRVVRSGPTPPPAPEPAAPAPRRLRSPSGWIRLRRARLRNLKDVDAAFPLGVRTGVCGVSGSGKSTLIHDTLIPLLQPGGESEPPGSGTVAVEGEFHGLEVVDQGPMTRTARSVPASFAGAWEPIRKVYAALPEARRLGLTAAAFSFNGEAGRCPACRGAGETVVDLDFLPDVRVPCEACRGGRFRERSLAVRYRGRTIADVLRLTVDEAVALFAAHPAVTRTLWEMQRVGLGYLVLGQSALTLSGGEAQRLKLVRALSGRARGRLFLLDEPTVGLHASEVARLAGVLDALVDAGNSVIVVEHNIDILAGCDWLLELGPEAGDAGGRLVAEGPPAVVARNPGSPTAPHLRARLSPAPAGVEVGA